MGSPAIVWLRNDLRLDDHPALAEACRAGGAVLPVFIHPDADLSPCAPGAASRWWLHHSLERLDAALRARGSRLVLRRGDPAHVLEELARRTGAGSVGWERKVEPSARRDEARVREALETLGARCHACAPNLLADPETTLTKSGGPFQVFTPFWKSASAQAPSPPLPAPARIPAPDTWPASLAVEDLGLLPTPDWAAGFREAWRPGEAGAAQALADFADGALSEYPTARDLPGVEGTSRLSPHLHFGEISGRRIVHELAARAAARGGAESAAEAWIRQLYWRDFGHHMLFHFPRTETAPLRETFAAFPWRDDPDAAEAWRRGRTGYPIVDAGMRELWRTGWMHNRVRMIVASFLVKDLLLPWQTGAAWFLDTLVDADAANNTLGWQWTSGCGPDAAPYFRVFNPVLQGMKFDPDGAYVRRWAPELAGLENRWIYRPWEAPAETLRAAGVTLGRTWPHPVVDHAAARDRALAAHAHLTRR
ncbi:MAG: deoxyribodipyrimidine photo-lyase [Candidatus Hydrogenedentes bacterium]|nr:deoxyribodipyrimidine photo-lyase [Candidatus Hydrogenedentota bacterium]